MRRPSAVERQKFTQYVSDSRNVVENLEFLLDNLGHKVVLDYSVASLAEVERIFWDQAGQGMSSELSDPNQFAQLIGQYLGECIIRIAGGRWEQSLDDNPMFAQPCVSGFGGKAWDRVYPVHLALHVRELPSTKPDFPGVRDKRVFVSKLEEAIRV